MSKRPGTRVAALKAESLIRQMSAGELEEAPQQPPTAQLRRTSSADKRVQLSHKAPQMRRITSGFRGVTHHCRTGRFEAHIWDSGKQVYLGGFDTEQEAALAYDVACVRFRGHEAQTNYDLDNYAYELDHLEEITKEEVVQSLRRQSKGNHQNSSQYRGVTLHQKGKWEARIGTLIGRKYKYLGLYAKEIDAALAYDREAVRRKGLKAITNFDLSSYLDLLSPEDIEQLKQQESAKHAETKRIGKGSLSSKAMQMPSLADKAAALHARKQGASDQAALKPGCTTLDRIVINLRASSSHGPDINPLESQPPEPSWPCALQITPVTGGQLQRSCFHPARQQEEAAAYSDCASPPNLAAGFAPAAHAGQMYPAGMGFEDQGGVRVLKADPAVTPRSVLAHWSPPCEEGADNAPTFAPGLPAAVPHHNQGLMAPFMVFHLGDLSSDFLDLDWLDKDEDWQALAAHIEHAGHPRPASLPPPPAVESSHQGDFERAMQHRRALSREEQEMAALLLEYEEVPTEEHPAEVV